jgi:hypothetical protein
VYVATVVNTLAGIQSIVNRSTLSQLLPPQEIGKRMEFFFKIKKHILIVVFHNCSKPYRVQAGGWNFKEIPYCATNSGSPNIELRFCQWIILYGMFKY